MPKGRAKKRITYTRRFVNVTLTGGKRKVPRASDEMDRGICVDVSSDEPEHPRRINVPDEHYSCLNRRLEVVERDGQDHWTTCQARRVSNRQQRAAVGPSDYDLKMLRGCILYSRHTPIYPMNCKTLSFHRSRTSSSLLSC